MSYMVAVEGMRNLHDFDQLSPKIIKAAIATVNRATDRARTASAKMIREQVNFPARYLSGKDGRLQVVKKANRADLSGVIRGRFEATSLARFAKQKNAKQARRRGGVDVTVEPGSSKFIPNAFIIQWKAGARGLALRLKEGESIRNKRYQVKMWNGLAILYGPSVDQVFRTVREDVSPEIEDFMDREFNRLLGVDF